MVKFGISKSRKWQTYIYYHFTALAGSNLAKQLQDEGLCHIPGQIPHIPLKNKYILVMEWETVEKTGDFSVKKFIGTLYPGDQHNTKTATQKYLVWYPNNPSTWNFHTFIEKAYGTQNLWHHIWRENNWGWHIIHHHSCWYLETMIAMMRSWMLRIVQRT